MNEIADLVYDGMKELAADPSRLLDPNYDIFAKLADTVPEVVEWRKERMEQTVLAADGVTKHFIHREVLAEARSPTPGSGNEQATPRMLELIKAMAEQAIEKMEDPKLAIADKLTSQDGQECDRRERGRPRADARRERLQRRRREQVRRG